MQIDSSLIHAFLHDLPMEQSSGYSYVSGFQQPDSKRKDVVSALLSELETIVEEFPVFNKDIWLSLFSDMDELLASLTIIPVVGSTSAPMRTEVFKHNVIILDLIHIADYTRILSQMTYIMQNYITLVITKLCIRHRYPLSTHHYLDMLDDMTFTHGLANWLAWNRNCKEYKFQDDRYEPHKEKAFGMLAQAITIENKALQHTVLHKALHSDFWNQFTAVAGMFYFDDVYHDIGKDDILLLYRHGPKHFIHTIFHTNDK